MSPETPSTETAIGTVLVAAAVPRIALSPREFEIAFGICHANAYEEINSGRLRAKKIGTSTRIAIEDAMEWFRNQPDYDHAKQTRAPRRPRKGAADKSHEL